MRRAGVRGGGWADKPRCVSMRSISAGASIAAMIFNLPPHAQRSTSMSNTRLSRLAQLMRAGAPCAWSPSAACAVCAGDGAPVAAGNARARLARAVHAASRCHSTVLRAGGSPRLGFALRSHSGRNARTTGPRQRNPIRESNGKSRSTAAMERTLNIRCAWMCLPDATAVASLHDKARPILP